MSMMDSDWSSLDYVTALDPIPVATEIGNSNGFMSSLLWLEWTRFDGQQFCEKYTE